MRLPNGRRDGPIGRLMDAVSIPHVELGPNGHKVDALNFIENQGQRGWSSPLDRQRRFYPIIFISVPVNARSKTPKEQIRNAILGWSCHNIIIESAS